MDVRNRARSDKERLGDIFVTTHAPRRKYGRFMFVGLPNLNQSHGGLKMEISVY
jgi:hypothetical protein